MQNSLIWNLEWGEFIKKKKHCLILNSSKEHSIIPYYSIKELISTADGYKTETLQISLL